MFILRCGAVQPDSVLSAGLPLGLPTDLPAWGGGPWAALWWPFAEVCLDCPSLGCRWLFIGRLKKKTIKINNQRQPHEGQPKQATVKGPPQSSPRPATPSGQVRGQPKEVGPQATTKSGCTAPYIHYQQSITCFILHVAGPATSSS